MYLVEVTAVRVRHKQMRNYESRLTDSVGDQQTESERSSATSAFYTTISGTRESTTVGRLRETGARCGETYFRNIPTGSFEPGRDAFGEPLTRNIWIMHSIVYSPAGRHIVSGPDNGSTQIWDVEPGAAIGKPLDGYSVIRSLLS